MNSGVYVWFNLINGSFYIGSTNNFDIRKKSHLSELRSGMHGKRNKNSQIDHLQKAWNKYGEENFEFIPIRFCKPEDCRKIEQEYLDKYVDMNGCYNIAKNASAPMQGRKHSESTKEKFRNRRHSEETKQKISTNHGKPMLGKHHSEETKLKINNTRIVREFKLISPNGKVFDGKNVRKFCRENNLDQSDILKLLKDKRKQCKGWTKYKGDYTYGTI